MSLTKATGAQYLKTETEKLKETIENMPRGKYQSKPTLIVKFEDRSKSGLTRWYNVYYVSEHNELLRLTWAINEVYKESGNGNRYDKRREALKVNGCGFDGAHEIVYDLGRILFNDGYALDYRGI
mgnify:FL=1|tara:strand:+ start:238 stop:612 length:375 start_codon:yes stop_codon:yes gene_type:complete